MKKVLIYTFIFTLSLGSVFALQKTLIAQENEESELEEKTEETLDKESLDHFRNGMRSGFLSLLYTPLKIGVSMTGGIVGGLAYPLSGFNEDVSKKIWDKSLGGTYLITERILTGEEELELFLKKSKDDNE